MGKMHIIYPFYRFYLVVIADLEFPCNNSGDSLGSIVHRLETTVPEQQQKNVLILDIDCFQHVCCYPKCQVHHIYSI